MQKLTRLVVIAGLSLTPVVIRAQHDHSAAPKTPASSRNSASDARSAEADAHVAAGADHAMANKMVAGLHVEMTPARAATRADSVRADSLVRVMRASIARYRDYHVAEKDGYRQFAPQVKGQKVLHFTNNRSAVRAAFGFSAERPTSLLYREKPDGSRELIGAMYTAPRRASYEELDSRVPLGMAQWHRHVNLCVPPRRDRERWTETRGGLPVFGPQSPIATEADCDAVGGKFHPQVFGWMVHANVFAGDDPATIWEHDHGDAKTHDH